MQKIVIYGLILLTTLACEQVVPTEKQMNREVTWNENIQKFSSCREMESYIESFRNTGLAESSVAASPQHYQNQVDGVQEGDLLQSSPSHFFFARPGSIEIVDRSSLAHHLTLKVGTFSWRRLLYSGQKLIFIAGDYQKTWVQVFDESNNFQTIYEKTHWGQPIDFRMIGNRLVITSRSYTYQQEMPFSCSEIYQPNLEDGASAISHVYTVDLADKNIRDQSLRILGAVDFIYMTDTNLFLFKNGHTNHSHFRVVDFKTAAPTLKQVAKFDGFAKDRWAIRTRMNHLFIATTFYEPNYWKMNNKIQVFELDSEKKYHHLSDSPSFGFNEDIRAVRYDKDKAYIVTFEKTDPLFILDLKNPEKIEIVSELKSPGFSTQLREIKNGKMIGLGYQAMADTGFSWFDGLKLSLFDFQELSSPREIDILKWGVRGTYSEATSENKALFISSFQDRILFPVVIVSHAQATRPWNMGKDLDFSGALVAEIQGEKIKEIGRLSHAEWRDRICGPNSFLPMQWWNYENVSSDIQRAIQIGEKIYTFSRFGVKVFSAFDLQEESKVEFASKAEICGQP